MCSKPLRNLTAETVSDRHAAWRRKPMHGASCEAKPSCEPRRMLHDCSRDACHGLPCCTVCCMLVARTSIDGTHVLHGPVAIPMMMD